MTLTIGLICFVLSYVMFMQFKTVEETNITQIESMREKELSESLANWKEKYEETLIKLEQTNKTLQEYKQKIEQINLDKVQRRTRQCGEKHTDTNRENRKDGDGNSRN